MAISNTTASTSQLNTTSLANTTSTATNTPNNAIRLVTGQVLNIFVTQTSQNQTQFTLGGQTFKATTPNPILETGNLQVQVKSTSPSLQLEILPNKNIPQNLSSQNQALIQHTLKNLLPNQMPITQAIQILSQPSFLQLLPSSLQAQIQTLLNQLLKPNNTLKSDSLKESIQNSGIFLENTLKNKNTPKADLKAKFLQLQSLAGQSTLSESTTKLAAVLGQAINKITLQQLQNLESPQSIYITPSLHPESDIEAIDIEIRKHPPQSNQQYEILLNIKLPEGEMITKLLLDKEDTLSAYIWGENSNLEAKISQNIPNLKQQLTDSAIKTNQIFLSKAKPQASTKAKQVALIDIRI